MRIRKKFELIESIDRKSCRWSRRVLRGGAVAPAGTGLLGVMARQGKGKASAAETREELVERARREREKREEDRRRDKAARLIQRNWAACRDLKRFRSGLADQWDARFGSSAAASTLAASSRSPSS